MTHRVVIQVQHICSKKIHQVQCTAHTNHTQTSNSIVTTVHKSHASCHVILSKDLIMRKVVLYVVPCPVTEAQCEKKAGNLSRSHFICR